MSRSLPPEPSLEQLKKQARELLTSFQANDPTAVDLFQQHLPRLAQGISPATGASPLNLSDAQLVLARVYGFASWPKLKSHIDGLLALGMTQRNQKGDRVMVEVAVHSVYFVENQQTGASDPVVVLKAQDQECYLPIWVAASQGNNIVAALQGQETPRPGTYTLMAQLVEDLGGHIEFVRIFFQAPHYYHAAVHVATNGTIHEVDCRPSDALSLAAQSKAAIFVDADTLKSNGVSSATAFMPWRVVEQLWLREAA